MSEHFMNTSIKKIKEASENNKLVVFVGAGVSANSGVVNWGQLIKELSKDLGDFNLDNSLDLYTKIPQYYFNERGEKEYYEKLRDIFFHKRYRPNPIHKEIFKLKPNQIITTNYDTLLEESAIDEGQFFHTVKQDLDLPYDNFNKTIIKMHGDFENNNIVLKEEDYLNYSSNFTLIESYIKSLITTSTVLFIGYSVNDSNFNLIFQWVKNILNSHFQPAYLIESNKQYSRMEHEYYKNRGINILYYNEIDEIKKHGMFDLDNDRGNKLFDLLSYFNSVNNMKNYSDLEVVYEKIRCFERLNFIMPEQIYKSIKTLGLNSLTNNEVDGKTLNILNGDNFLYRVFSKYNEVKDKEVFKNVLLIFKKANITRVAIDGKVIINIEEDYKNDLMMDIIKNDHFKVNIEKNVPLYGTEEENYFIMLHKAFEYFKNDYYIEAYKYYKMISLKAFRDKEYLVYYISEFNRKNVGKFLDDKYYYDIKMENNELDLEEIYANLPYKEKKSLEFLTEIQNFNFIYKVQNKLNNKLDELKKTKHIYEKGGFAFNNSLHENFTITKNIFLFIESNYLCVNKFEEVNNLYTNFIEGLFANHSTPFNNSEILFYDDTTNKLEKIDVFETYTMITKLKTKELERLLEVYNISTLNLEYESLKYIMNIIDKIIGNMNTSNEVKNKKRLSNLLLRLSNLLLILSKSNVSEEQANEVAVKLLPFINNTTDLNLYKYINRYVVSLANNKLFKQQTVSKYIEKYLRTYLNSNKIIEDNSYILYRSLTNIYKEFKQHTIDKDILSNLIYLTDKMYQEGQYDNLYNNSVKIIVPIIEDFDKKDKQLLINAFKKLVENIANTKNSIRFKEIHFYYEILINDIIVANKKVNKKLLESVLKMIHEKGRNAIMQPDPLLRNLNIITDLYRKNKITKREIKKYCNDFKGHSEYFDLVFNNINPKINDVDILHEFKDEEINTIMQGDIINDNVYNLFEKRLESKLLKKDKQLFKKLYVKKY
ncbi:SIR2 family protein [Staphylococcus shinii]|uniref:SIR2 family protein n=1 Tax=Staphylococcus shinii TaxID=2912228 RepID=UPI003F87D6E5